MTKVTLFVPHLFHPKHRELIKESAHNQALSLVMADKYRQPVTVSHFDEMLANLFDCSDQLPIAKLRAHFDGLKQTELLCADPVHIHADFSGAFLQGNEHLQITEQETSELIKSLNQFLQQDGLTLHYAAPQRWYISGAMIKEWPVKPLFASIGKDMTGAAQPHAQMQRLLTELQMLLAQHPINLRRQEKQLPAINSLWFWGHGDENYADGSQWDLIVSNEVTVRSVANDLQVSCSPAVTFDEALLAQHQQVLIVLDDFLQGQHLADAARFEQVVGQWLVPLYRMLGNKRLDELTIIGDFTSQFRLKKKKSLWWWLR